MLFLSRPGLSRPSLSELAYRNQPQGRVAGRAPSWSHVGVEIALCLDSAMVIERCYNHYSLEQPPLSPPSH